MKILTVIIPSYNMEDYLQGCLDSLGVDNYPFMQDSLEVLIVNDGSKDRTSEIAHEYERQWPAVFRVIDKANGNHGSCVNRGLDEAEGVFVRVLDADDTFDAQAFSEYIEFMRKVEASAPDTVDQIVSNYVEVGPEGRVLQTFIYDYPVGHPFALSEIVNKPLHQALSANAYRTERVRAIDYRQTEGISYSDNEWRFKPIANVRKAAYFPKVVYRYLIGRPGQSMSGQVWMRSSGMLMRVLEAMLKEYAFRKTEMEDGNRQVMFKDLLQTAALVVQQLFYYVPIRESASRFKVLIKAINDNVPELFPELDKQVICQRFLPFYYFAKARACPNGFVCYAEIVRGLRCATRMIKGIIER